MHHSIAAYAKAGNNVAVDYIPYEKEWFLEFVNALKGIKVYYIGLKYPLQAMGQLPAAPVLAMHQLQWRSSRCAL